MGLFKDAQTRVVNRFRGSPARGVRSMMWESLLAKRGVYVKEKSVGSIHGHKIQGKFVVNEKDGKYKVLDVSIEKDDSYYQYTYANLRSAMKPEGLHDSKTDTVRHETIHSMHPEWSEERVRRLAKKPDYVVMGAITKGSKTLSEDD